MQIITRQSNANGAAEHWALNYADDLGLSNDPFLIGPGEDTDSPAGIHKRLVALGPTPKPADIDNIIGNKSWTTGQLQCDECKRPAKATVEIGGQVHEDQQSSTLCVRCIRKALALLEAAL